MEMRASVTQRGSFILPHAGTGIEKFKEAAKASFRRS